MKISNEHLEEHPLPQPPAGVFYIEPYDEYEKLRDQLTEIIPDFKLRLKTDPKSNRLVFAVDIDSVFDIAWYALARMMAEDPAPEDFGKADRPNGIMAQCAHCGRFFFPRDGRQKYCTDHDCFKSRKALYKRWYRAKGAQSKARSKKNKG